jgi:hypothetical protein
MSDSFVLSERVCESQKAVISGAEPIGEVRCPPVSNFTGIKNNREPWTTSWLFVNFSGVGFSRFWVSVLSLQRTCTSGVLGVSIGK